LSYQSVKYTLYTFIDIFNLLEFYLIYR